MLKKSGLICAKIIQRLCGFIKAGISTRELDELAGELMRKANAKSAFKGYKGFPANICTSINEEIVHGIPDGRKLKESDIISLDMGINYAGITQTLQLQCL